MGSVTPENRSHTTAAMQPVCISLKSAAEASKIIQTVTPNEVLVHQLLMQGEGFLQLETPLDKQQLAEEDPVGASLHDVATTAQRAFWDVVRESLERTPLSWDRVVVLIIDARDKILEVVPNSSERARAVRSQLKEQVDEGYVSMRLTQAFDPDYLRQLFDHLVNVVKTMEAPVHTESTEQAYAALLHQLDSASRSCRSATDTPWVAVQLTCPTATQLPSPSLSDTDDETNCPSTTPRLDNNDAVAAGTAVSMQLQVVQPGLSGDMSKAITAALRFVTEKVSELRMDVVKYRLRMLRSLLNSNASGVDYERRRFADAVSAAGSVASALPKTARWISDAHAEASLIITQGMTSTVSLRLTVMYGLLSLMQVPVALTPKEVPETLVLDGARVVGFQNELQRLSLTAASAVMASSMVVMVRDKLNVQGGAGMRAALLDLPRLVKARFIVLLTSPHIRLDDLIEEMTEMVCSTVEAGGEEKIDRNMAREPVAHMLGKVFSTTDPIYQRVQRRLLVALRASLCASCTSPGVDHTQLMVDDLRAVGAEVLLSETKSLAQEILKLMRLNIAVCEPYYSAIIAAAKTEE